MALSFRASNAANGGTSNALSTGVMTLPTGWQPNDLIYFAVSIGSNMSSPVMSGWNFLGPDLNSDSTGRSLIAYRTMQTGDTDPTLTWTTNGKYAWSAICIQPASGATATHSGVAGPTIDATNTTHTSPAFAAGALTGMSVLMTGYREGANAATAITTTAPTNWTEPATGADTSTASGTTSATRQVSSWHAYWAGQTGTITPGAQTASVSAVANLYHLFAVETGGSTYIAPRRRGPNYRR